MTTSSRSAVADLVHRAGRGGDPSEQRLDHARLLLEFDRVERAVARARSDRVGDLASLAREREAVLADIRNVGQVLEQAM